MTTVIPSTGIVPTSWPTPENVEVDRGISALGKCIMLARVMDNDGSVRSICQGAFLLVATYACHQRFSTLIRKFCKK
jgi:hypothetical protein